MGNVSSEYQRMEVSENGKWLVLPDCGAYINVACVAFFVVQRAGEGYRLTIKLLDNDNDKPQSGGSWYSWAGQPLSKVASALMNRQQLDTLVDALTKR